MFFDRRYRSMIAARRRRPRHRQAFKNCRFHGRVVVPLRQRGFSSLEILIATILIGLLVAGGVYYANIGDKVNAVNMASVQTAAVVRFPEAIMTIYSQTNNLAAVDKNDLIGTRSVIDNRPVVWSVPSGGADTATNTEISIRFVLADNNQAGNFLSYISAGVNTTMVKSARRVPNSSAVIVRYAVANV